MSDRISDDIPPRMNETMNTIRVKSGKFGQSAKFGQRVCLFHILIIKIKNKLRKQTVKILMRRLVSSGFPPFAKECPNLPEVRSYLTLPYPLIDKVSTEEKINDLILQKQEKPYSVLNSKLGFIGSIHENS